MQPHHGVICPSEDVSLSPKPSYRTISVPTSDLNLAGLVHPTQPTITENLSLLPPHLFGFHSRVQSIQLIRKLMHHHPPNLSSLAVRGSLARLHVYSPSSEEAARMAAAASTGYDTPSLLRNTNVDVATPNQTGVSRGTSSSQMTENSEQQCQLQTTIQQERNILVEPSQLRTRITFEALYKCPENPLQLEHELISQAEFVRQMKKRSEMRRRRSAHRGPCTTDIAQAHLKEFHKNEGECERLLKVLKSSQFFKLVPDDELKSLCKYFYPVSHKKGDPIILQNDVGKTFFVIERGSVDVFKAAPGNRSNSKAAATPNNGSITSPKDHPKYGQYLTTLSDNDFFGEIALLLNCKRTATCIASSSQVKLWALDSEAFHKINCHLKDAQFSANLSLFRHVDLFKTLPEHNLKNIVGNMKILSFKPSFPIVKQGDIGDYFYIILKGKVRVMKNGVMVNIIRDGSYFGELALLDENSRRNATVIAMRDVRCGVLTRQCFHASIYETLYAKLMERASGYKNA